jgi:STE24 endopeptidase
MEFFNILNFQQIFIVVIAIKIVLENYLASRNINSINKNKETVPERFKDLITREEYSRAINYNISKLKFQIVSSVATVAFLLLFTLGGLLNSMTKLVTETTDSNIFGAILLSLLFIIVSEIAGMPFSIYSTFFLEAKYGFNKTTIKTFILDLIKRLVLSAILLSIMFSIIVLIIQNFESIWWLYAFVALFIFQLILVFLYPTLIAPLFNKFEPLTDERFKKPIEKLLKKVEFRAKGLFVMNASLRSSHGNAFFTGFGKSKRIVFFDTLLETITPDEMEAILAHELGHSKLGHIKKRLITTILVSFLGFYILGWVFNSNNFFIDHGLTELTIFSKILLFGLIFSSYTFMFRPISSFFSRKREFEADDFSLKYTKGEYMISGLLKLTKDNASNLTPDPLYSSYYYSHPPIAERIKSLEEKLRLS